MKNEYNKIDIELLKEFVKKSDSIKEVIIKLGLNENKDSVKKNIERLIRQNNIGISHFSSFKKLYNRNHKYLKENLEPIVLKNYTYKDILLDLDLLCVESNYKTLKKYIKKYNINDTHLQIIQRNNSKKYDEDKLRQTVSNSNTLSDTIRNLGLRAAGGNFNTIRKLIIKYNIDTTHFSPNEVRNHKLINFSQLKKISLSNILIENSTYSRTELKKRLYDEGIKERKCEICGQTEEWMGKKMSLILDHINGKYNDNRIENLRIVCPNCNATLETHCGKNNKKDKTHPVEISQERISRRKCNRPPYDVLMNDIKNMGYCGSGRKYGVSDNAIRKWKKSYENE